MEFEGLIFDIDGTLWDSRALVAAGYNRQLQAEGYGHLAVKAQELTPLFGKVAEDIADVLFASLPKPERYQLLERCMEEEQRYLQENECRVGYPGVREVLEILARSHRLFIVSNSSKGYPEVCMEKLGIGHLIQGHLCFGDTLTCKGETIKTLMTAHGITSACYIGDTLGDQEAAELAGLPFIYCAYGFGQSTRHWRAIGKFEDLLHL